MSRKQYLANIAEISTTRIDIACQDEDCDVRIAVANQGYGLDVLVNDKVWIVRDAAEAKLSSL